MVNLIQTIEEFNICLGCSSCTRLATTGNLIDADEKLFQPLKISAYAVVLLENEAGEVIKNGRTIRYHDGAVICFRPGDSFWLKQNQEKLFCGQILIFHSDILANSDFGRISSRFSFFNSDLNEPLIISRDEVLVVKSCLDTLDKEFRFPVDGATESMVQIGIYHLLMYLKRFYVRQFQEWQLAQSDLIRKLNALLDDYYAPDSRKPELYGPPTVAWCAKEMNVAANYLGTLVKRDVHISAQEFIQNHIVRQARKLLAGTSDSVNSISVFLGFTYPNHFTRLFTKKEGITPTAYRRMNRMSGKA